MQNDSTGADEFLSRSAIQKTISNSNQPRRILVVEDCSSSRLIMSHFLNSMNFHTQTVSNGEEALNLAERNRFDIVFMDISLPGIDGYETIERLKTECEHHHAKFVIFTGYSTTGDPVGISEVLAKPFTRSSLVCCLQSVLGYSYNQTTKALIKQSKIYPGFKSAHA